jgi:hypothetical protein
VRKEGIIWEKKRGRKRRDKNAMRNTKPKRQIGQEKEQTELKEMTRRRGENGEEGRSKRGKVCE